jgi:hypothetical protein
LTDTGVVECSDSKNKVNIYSFRVSREIYIGTMLHEIKTFFVVNDNYGTGLPPILNVTVALQRTVGWFDF